MILAVCGVLVSCGSSTSDSDSVSKLTTGEDRAALEKLVGQRYVTYQTELDGSVSERKLKTSLLHLSVVSIGGSDYDVSHNETIIIDGYEYQSYVYQEEGIDFTTLWRTVSDTEKFSYQFANTDVFNSSLELSTTESSVGSSSIKYMFNFSGSINYTAGEASGVVVSILDAQGTFTFDSDNLEFEKYSLTVPFSITIPVDSTSKTYTGTFKSKDVTDLNVTATLYSEDGLTQVGKIEITEDSEFEIYVYNEEGDLELLE